MRRLLIISAITIAATFQLKSQNLILNAGLNISNMNIAFYDYDLITNWYPIFSPDLMINYEFQINKSFSVKPGLAYSRQGRRLVSDLGSNFYQEYKYIIDFVDFPLLVCYNFNTRSTGGYNLNLNAGPYFSYGLNGQKIEDITAIVSKERLFVGEDAILRNDYGIMFMAGFGFPDNQLALYIQLGLKNMATTDSDYTKFSRAAIGLNYVKIIAFDSNARRMLRKRFF